MVSYARSRTAGDRPRPLRVPVALVTVVVTVVLLSLGFAGPASADDPIYIGWSSLLPPAPGEPAPDPTSDDSLTGACSRGKPACVKATISLMQNQLDGFAAPCDHKAVFALAYLRTTQAYQNAASIDGYFNDVTWVNREDVIFAGYYFTALADWQQGNAAAVPPAWRIAFDAADHRAESGSGDLLLGMNAHVNRDLPFVLAGLGLVTPDGQMRKPDQRNAEYGRRAVARRGVAAVRPDHPVHQHPVRGGIHRAAATAGCLA